MTGMVLSDLAARMLVDLAPSLVAESSRHPQSISPLAAPAHTLRRSRNIIYMPFKNCTSGTRHELAQTRLLHTNPLIRGHCSNSHTPRSCGTQINSQGTRIDVNINRHNRRPACRFLQRDAHARARPNPTHALCCPQWPNAARAALTAHSRFNSLQP